MAVHVAPAVSLIGSLGLAGVRLAWADRAAGARLLAPVLLGVPAWIAGNELPIRAGVGPCRVGLDGRGLPGVRGVPALRRHVRPGGLASAAGLPTAALAPRMPMSKAALNSHPGKGITSEQNATKPNSSRNDELTRLGADRSVTVPALSMISKSIGRSWRHLTSTVPSARKTEGMVFPHQRWNATLRGPLQPPQTAGFPHQQ